MRLHSSLNNSTTYNDMLAATQIYSRLDLLTSVVETLVYYSFADELVKLNVFNFYLYLFFLYSDVVTEHCHEIPWRQQRKLYGQRIQRQIFSG